MLCTAEYFANELNRLRPLREDEIERLIGCKVGKRRLWTARDDRQLQRMARQGMTAHMIALKMGRTAWAVRSRVRNLKRKQQNTGAMQNGTR